MVPRPRDRVPPRIAPATVIQSMMKLLRVSAPVTMFFLCVLFVAPLHAQQNLPPAGAYQAIPDFTGNNAGLSFRGAINDRLSGVQPISPRITNQTFSSLPAEKDRLLIFCKDCEQTIPCAHGGAGAWAFGQN